MSLPLTAYPSIGFTFVLEPSHPSRVRSAHPTLPRASGTRHLTPLPLYPMLLLGSFGSGNAAFPASTPSSFPASSGFDDFDAKF